VEVDVRVRDEVVIGVGTDSTGWYEEVVNALRRAREAGAPVRTELMDLHAHDWVGRARTTDAIIWNPQFMGPISASFLKEKIYFLQHVIGTRVMPNWESVWHFESKVAQSYLLAEYDVPRPRTVVSFEMEDAATAATSLGIPVVAKGSFGASSENVMLLRTQAELDHYLEREFAQQLWNESKSTAGSAFKAIASNPPSRWLGEKVRRRVMGAERLGYVYLQEFIPDNDSDIRISVAGRRATGCRRVNRAHDFRASGSGQIIRGHDLPLDAIALCMQTRERIGADSLAFDVLYRDGVPLIVEISYVQALSSSPAHWVKEADGTLTRIEGEIWDQEMWVKHVLEGFGL
jgi:glutathione synthase/RimK-type ligase-like ATP-grasp enzyme